MSLRPIAQVLCFPSLINAIPVSVRTNLTTLSYDMLMSAVFKVQSTLLQMNDNKDPEYDLNSLLEQFVIAQFQDFQGTTCQSRIEFAQAQTEQLLQKVSFYKEITQEHFSQFQIVCFMDNALMKLVEERPSPQKEVKSISDLAQGLQEHKDLIQSIIDSETDQPKKTFSCLKKADILVENKVLSQESFDTYQEQVNCFMTRYVLLLKLLFLISNLSQKSDMAKIECIESMLSQLDTQALALIQKLKLTTVKGNRRTRTRDPPTV